MGSFTFEYFFCSCHDFRSCCHVGVVAEAAAFAGTCFDKNGMTVLFKRLYAAGSKCHAVLVRLDFLGNSDDHDEIQNDCKEKCEIVSDVYTKVQIYIKSLSRR